MSDKWYGRHFEFQYGRQDEMLKIPGSLQKQYQFNGSLVDESYNKSKSSFQSIFRTSWQP